MSLVLFAYNFPHKKTQDFIFRLVAEGLKPDLVLANEWENLNISSGVLRVKPRHIDLIHPKQICSAFGIAYHVVKHNSQECESILKAHHSKIGVIAGARILKQNIINAVEIGIINFHPGLMPQVRGLDALQWSIYEGHAIGVTAHIIDKRVDAGHVIKREIIKEYADDTLIDLSLRLQQTEVNMVCEAVRTVKTCKLDEFEAIASGLPYHRKMPAELEARIPMLLQARLGNLSS
jgi:phosphoribosylglycinamide formyltransferase-1